MDRAFPTFIFSVKYVDPLGKLQSLVMDLSKILNRQSFEDHSIPVLSANTC